MEFNSRHQVKRHKGEESGVFTTLNQPKPLLGNPQQASWTPKTSLLFYEANHQIIGILGPYKTMLMDQHTLFSSSSMSTNTFGLGSTSPPSVETVVSRLGLHQRTLDLILESLNRFFRQPETMKALRARHSATPVKDIINELLHVSALQASLSPFHAMIYDCIQRKSRHDRPLLNPYLIDVPEPVVMAVQEDGSVAEASKFTLKDIKTTLTKTRKPNPPARTGPLLASYLKNDIESAPKVKSSHIIKRSVYPAKSHSLGVGPTISRWWWSKRSIPPSLDGPSSF